MQKRRFKGRRNFQKPQQHPHRINDNIRIPTIRLVGDNVEAGIVDTRSAKELAKELGLDLVEISPKADPPVCKILDYSKFLFDQRKREKQNKKNSNQMKVKEIKFGPNTDDHDIEFKLRHAENFLDKGHKVKVFVEYRGRQMAHKEIGEKLLLGFLMKLEEKAKVDYLPKMEGRRLTTMLTPKQKK